MCVCVCVWNVQLAFMHVSDTFMQGKNIQYNHHGALLAPPPPEQNFSDDTFRYIFVNERFCILIKISLKFVPSSSIDNISQANRQAIICTNADPIH